MMLQQQKTAPPAVMLFDRWLVDRLHMLGGPDSMPALHPDVM